MLQVWYDLMRLEAKHGSCLVHHAFCYLALSPRGLSEVEVRDVLSCDNQASVTMRTLYHHKGSVSP